MACQPVLLDLPRTGVQRPPTVDQRAHLLHVALLQVDGLRCLWNCWASLICTSLRVWVPFVRVLRLVFEIP